MLQSIIIILLISSNTLVIYPSSYYYSNVPMVILYEYCLLSIVVMYPLFIFIPA